MKNKGREKADPFSVEAKLFTKQKNLFAQNKAKVSELDRDKRKPVLIYFPYLISGDLVGEVTVDSENKISESNEGNNKKEFLIYVAPKTTETGSETNLSLRCLDSDG